ncbi:MAG: IS3 family transposase [Candidatus Enteromonas sp.]
MPKKTKCLSSGKEGPTTEEKVAVVAELRRKHGLKTLLRASGLKRATFYYTLKKLGIDAKNEDVIEQTKEIYDHHRGRHGCRRILLELANRGRMVNHKKVRRIMRNLGTAGIAARGEYNSYKGDQNGVCRNLLLVEAVDEEKRKTKYERGFSTTGCNQKWTTDVSEFHIAAGKVYLSPVLDMHNREIVAFSISRHPNFAQTRDMLEKALKKFGDLKGLVFHSDQGWQYQMRSYREELEKRGIRQSMSRKGNCLDNSPMENFFGVMKNEMFYGHEFEFKTLEELEKAMRKYIECYNKERIMEKTKGLSPCAYRQQPQVQLARKTQV